MDSASENEELGPTYLNQHHQMHDPAGHLLMSTADDDTEG